MSDQLQPGLGRRMGRQALTVFLALITLAVGALLTWGSLAPARDTGLPRAAGDTGLVNDLPANLTWLLLIGIAIVAWRQLGIGLVTTVGCAAMVILLSVVEIGRYNEAGQGGIPVLLIFVIAVIEAGSFLVVGFSAGIFGWRQREKFRTTP